MDNYFFHKSWREKVFIDYKDIIHDFINFQDRFFIGEKLFKYSEDGNVSLIIYKDKSKRIKWKDYYKYDDNLNEAIIIRKFSKKRNDTYYEFIISYDKKYNAMFVSSIGKTRGGQPINTYYEYNYYLNDEKMRLTTKDKSGKVINVDEYKYERTEDNGIINEKEKCRHVTEGDTEYKFRCEKNFKIDCNGGKIINFNGSRESSYEFYKDNRIVKMILKNRYLERIDYILQYKNILDSKGRIEKQIIEYKNPNSKYNFQWKLYLIGEDTYYYCIEEDEVNTLMIDEIVQDFLNCRETYKYNSVVIDYWWESYVNQDIQKHIDKLKKKYRVNISLECD